MADDVDLASARMEQEEAFRLDAMRANAANAPAPTGFCLYCDEPVEHPKKYCNGECADEHAYQLKREAQNGRR